MIEDLYKHSIYASTHTYTYIYIYTHVAAAYILPELSCEEGEVLYFGGVSQEREEPEAR